jgi:uncharacterized surface protein with fasciclin (FAS1) repeats
MKKAITKYTITSALVLAVTATFFMPMTAEAGGRHEMLTIAAVASGNPDFSTLVAALDAAGLVETFNGKKHYTVFAPTNAAFDKALGDLGITAEQLLADTELLTSILLFHVTNGDRKAQSVVSAKKIKMLDGNDAMIMVKEDGAYINNAKIVTTDIMASNGIIHVIDYVLLPPSE